MLKRFIRTGLGALSVAAATAAMPVMGYSQGQNPAQNTVTGRVVNAETLAPLSGVLVSLQGANAAVLTGADGRYSIVAPGTGTLVFSMLGFTQHTEPINNRSVVDVGLQTTALALDEIVAVGYATQTRATVSGSVSTVSSEDLERSSSTTMADMLVGKLAGINTRMVNTTSNLNFGGAGGRVPRDGRPGSSGTLQIRNMGEPLFIIDGVPQTALEFNQLNSADIENISILKDASAAVYGFRAANGVVLVTTKRGQVEQRPQLRVDGYYGWQSIDRSRTPFGWANTAYQFQYSIVESQQNRGEARTIPREILENYRIGAPGYESYESFPAVVNNQGAMQANLSANLSGGTGDATYYLSLGHVTQDYVMDDNNFNRTNLQANLQTDLFDSFRIGAEIRGRLEKHITTSITNLADPITVHFQSIQSTWPHENWFANNNPNYINGDVRYIVRAPPIFNRDVSGTQDQIRRNLNSTFWARYTLPFGTVAEARYSKTNDTEDFDIHRYTFDAYCYDEETDTYNVCYTYQDQTRQSVRGVREADFANFTLSQSLGLGSHTISAVAGVEINGGESTESMIQAVPPNNFNSTIDFVNVTNAETSWNINRRASYFGRLNYDYEQRYLVELLGRYDGSYLYAPGKRWGFFPGVSVGWRITQEPFMQDRLGFLDELKLRASWGETGREQGIQAWGFLGGASYGVGNGAVLDGARITGVRPRGLPITNLSWVTSVARNIGFDFAMFDGKLGGELDFFERKLSGIPAARYDVLLPSEVGYSLPNENLESESNIGLDGVIRYSSRIGEVNYSIAPNFTLSRRRILDRYKPRYANSWDRYRNASEHRWAGVNFNYHVIGQFQSMEEIANYPINIDGQGNRTLLPGDLIFEDVNGDGIISPLDQRPRGYSSAADPPILSYGLSGTFSYAGFTLSYDWAGGSFFSFNPGSDLRIPYTSDHNGGAYIWSRWRRADPYDDNSEWIPGKFPPLRKAQNNHSSYRNSDFTYTNVHFLRLRRVELGYNVPATFSDHLGLSRVRVYTSAQNPWLIDNTDWAMDPEVAQCCGQVYPTTRVVNVGFSATVGGGSRPAPAVPVQPNR